MHVNGHRLTPDGLSWTCQRCHVVRDAPADYESFACVWVATGVARAAMVLLLLMATAAGAQPGGKYDRGQWRHWTDRDGDCQKTNVEVMVRDAVPGTIRWRTDRCVGRKAPRWTRHCDCEVKYLELRDPYSGQLLKGAPVGLIDGDHVVPLANAHRSGGDTWTAEQRETFANDEDCILPVSARLNRQKGDKGPDLWVPPRAELLCAYGKLFRDCKAKYGLRLIGGEAAAIAEMLATCEVRP